MAKRKAPPNAKLADAIELVEALRDASYPMSSIQTMQVMQTILDLLMAVNKNTSETNDLIASLATAVRDLYVGYPVKELHEQPRDLLARVITYFQERGELDDDMRATWTVD